MDNTGRVPSGEVTAGTVDVPAAVRAASAGFTVLLLGGLLAPIAATYIPYVGQVWLSLVAVAAFAMAGSRIGQARAPHLHGACAALGSYLLVLPLVVWFTSGTEGVGVVQILATAVAAVAIGGLAGLLAGRRRDKSPVGDS